MRLLSADEVHARLDYPGLIEALRLSHLSAPPGAVHLVADEPGGGDSKFVALIAWSKGETVAAKLVGVFPGNRHLQPPQSSVQGLVAVFDGATGAPQLVADGAAMTFRKTAADSALGAKLLAREDAETLLVLGAGGLAPHMIAAHCTARPSIRRVLIWNRTHARAARLAASLFRAGVSITATADLDGAVAQADIVSCVTMSTAPLVRGECLRPGTHLDLVGAYLPTMREADDTAVAQATKFVDTRNGMENAGDLAQPVAEGLMAWTDIKADLFELCSGRICGRSSDREMTLFKNVGGGHLDLFTAKYLSSLSQSG